MKILTTIANYNGNSNPYIERVTNELKTISDVVIFSPDEMDIEGVKTEIRSKDLGQGFTFAPRQYILDHIDDYDYVLYNEDDVLIPQESLEYAIQINEKLIRHNLQYTVGFLLSMTFLCFYGVWDTPWTLLDHPGAMLDQHIEVGNKYKIER